MSQNPPKRHLARRVGYVAIAASVLLICGFYFPYWRPIYWSNRAALQKEIDAAKHRGTPIRFSDLVVEDPAGFELGERVKSALESLVEIPSEIRDKQFSDEALTDNDKAKIREILVQNQNFFRRIERAKPLGECRFRYDFQSPAPMMTFLPEVQAISSAGNLYLTDYQLAMESEDFNQALHSIVDLLELTEALRKEVFTVSQIVRWNQGTKALNALNGILEKTDLRDEQFQRLDALLKNIESEISTKHVVLAEGASTFTHLNNIGHPEVQEALRSTVSLGADNQIYDDGPSKRDLIHWSTLAYLPHLMDQQAWALRTTDRLSKVVDETGPTATLEWNNLQAEIAQKINSDRRSPLAAFLPSTNYLRSQAFDYRHRLALARIAIRLRRYATQHGSFPTSLTEIVDEALPKLPLNLWNDQPVTYQLTATGCEISLQAENETESKNISIAIPLIKNNRLSSRTNTLHGKAR